MLLLLLFIVVPLAELYVIIQVGGAIGILPTIALLFLDSILGAALLRWQGRAAWMRFNKALAEGRAPAKEVMDGAMIIFGGALLLTPGFLTDILGIALLLPPTRALLRRAAARSMKKRAGAAPRVATWGMGRMGEQPGPVGDPFGPGGPFEGHRPGDPFGGGTGPFGGHGTDPSRGSGSAAGQAGPAPSHPFGRPPSPARGRRPGDIEGTATEVGELDPAPEPPTEPDQKDS